MAQLGQRQSPTSCYILSSWSWSLSVDAIHVPVVRNCESNAGCRSVADDDDDGVFVLLDTLASEDEYSSSSSSFTPPGELCLLWLSCCIERVYHSGH